MKRNMIIEIISYLLFLLFSYTALAKIFTFKTFEFDLGRDPLLDDFSLVLAVTIPLVELIVSVFLIIPKYRRIGLLSSFILMALFTIYVAYILAFKNEERHCTCGGFIREMSWRQHLWFNLALTLAAWLGVFLSNKIKNIQKEPSSGDFINSLT